MDIMSYLLIAGLILISVCSIISRVLSGRKGKHEDEDKKGKNE